MTTEFPILIVEDNDDDLFILQRALRTAGVAETIRNVSDGEAALDYFSGKATYRDRSAFPLPRLVLLDLKLPKVHGHDVLSWIRKQPALTGVVVIVLSSSKEPADIEKAYAYGANAYLVKPSAINELVDAIKAIQAFWLRYNIFNTFPQPG